MAEITKTETHVAIFENVLPEELVIALGSFLLDKKTGNIKINVKDGRVMGCHVEEIIAMAG